MEWSKILRWLAKPLELLAEPLSSVDVVPTDPKFYVCDEGSYGSSGKPPQYRVLHIAVQVPCEVHSSTFFDSWKDTFRGVCSTGLCIVPVQAHLAFYWALAEGRLVPVKWVTGPIPHESVQRLGYTEALKLE